MKRYFICTFIFLSACGDAGSDGISTQSETLPDVSSIALPENPKASEMTKMYLSEMHRKMALAGEIGRIETRDQYVREVFIDMFSDPTLDPEVRTAFQKSGGEYVTAIDKINTDALKIILKGMSWRDLAQGDESRLATRAFHIVQHSNDLNFQLDTLAQIKPLAEEGLMEGQSYALLYDRTALKKEGGQQLYGSQTKCINSQYDVHNVEDSENVNDRRKSMGLEPLDVYLKGLREHYGPC